MTADSQPPPGEHTAGRHRPERLHPLGLELQRVLARCGYRWAPIHTHHASEMP